MVNRVGEVNFNKHGSKMEIIEYNSASDITVKFENGYTTNGFYSNFKTGKIKSPYDISVHGKGFIGEGKFKVSEGCEMTLPYQHWQSMLQRCYCDKFKARYSYYNGCTVCKEWHNFQNFAEWFCDNYYKVDNERMCVDKDILVKNNKIYSSQTCLIVPNTINALFVRNKSTRGNTAIGISLHTYKGTTKYRAKCGQKSLGVYSDEKEAFRHYKEAKEAKIKKIADQYKNKIPPKLYYTMYNYKIEITD